MANELTAARLQVIAAKAKILAEQYKNGRLWDTDLNKGLCEIESEIASLRTGDKYAARQSDSDWYGDRL